MSNASSSSAPASVTPVRFSPRRVWTLAYATMTQLMRMKILPFLLLFCALVAAMGFGFSVINPEQQLTQFKTMSLGVLQVFSIVFGIVATALLLPKDLEDRTLYTILSKPVPRFDYVLGKLLGVLMLIASGLVIIDAVLSFILWLQQSMLFNAAVAQLHTENQDSPEAVAQMREIVARQGLTWNLHWAVWAIFLKASVVTTVALLLSCIASSTLFTIVITFCITIIGHGHAMIREFVFQPNLGSTATRISTFVLAAICPDLAQFDVVDSVANGEIVPWAAVYEMTGIAALYITVYLFVTHLVFVEKEL
ncbi:ABC transporter permease subunit [Prosthecobacter sp.]|uniref:ABC transporter permease subunit n=1 Tax=Prosthecobacter sp. TaxID=1965333 RepID=UPI0024870156|nr:ABC transporter permease subunit [Prosthecobacter sp.]MDI1312671.1 ABC transporter permease subunit [Prosthecobacter sp.]